MDRTRIVRLSLATIATITLLLLPRIESSAQDVTEAALKAGLIYNFAKFTEWPADALPAKAPLALCVVGDTAVGDALQRAVLKRVLAGHPLTVTALPFDGAVQKCHIVFVSGLDAPRTADVLARLRKLPVLTIGDSEKFTEVGGMVRFFFESGQVKLVIRLAAVSQARLQISSRLLVFAKIE